MVSQETSILPNISQTKVAASWVLERVGGWGGEVVNIVKAAARIIIESTSFAVVTSPLSSNLSSDKLVLMN